MALSHFAGLSDNLARGKLTGIGAVRSANDVHGGSHRTILFVEYFHGYQKAPTTIFESTPLSNTDNCRSDRLKQMASEVFRGCSVMTWTRTTNPNEGEEPCQSSSLRVHQDSPGMQRSN